MDIKRELLLVKVKGETLIKSQDLDVEPSFCTGLYEHGTMLLCFGFSFASGHFPGDIISREQKSG